MQEYLFGIPSVINIPVTGPDEPSTATKPKKKMSGPMFFLVIAGMLILSAGAILLALTLVGALVVFIAPLVTLLLGSALAGVGLLGLVVGMVKLFEGAKTEMGLEENVVPSEVPGAFPDLPPHRVSEQDTGDHLSPVSLAPTSIRDGNFHP